MSDDADYIPTHLEPCGASEPAPEDIELVESIEEQKALFVGGMLADLRAELRPLLRRAIEAEIREFAHARESNG